MDDYFIKTVNSIINTVYQDNRNYLFDFLAEEEIVVVSQFLKHYPTIELLTDGGIIGAKRQRVYLKITDDAVEMHIKVIKVTFNDTYKKISHRNVLGNLIALGIKRECIGDIVVGDGYAYIAVCDTLVTFLLDNWLEINHLPIKILVMEDKVTNVDNGVFKTIFPASMRVDAIIAASFSLSREKASSLFAKEAVKINQKIVLKAFQNVSNCDIISVAHYGRIEIVSCLRITRSGRRAIDVKIYR